MINYIPALKMTYIPRFKLKVLQYCDHKTSVLYYSADLKYLINIS